MSDGQSAKDVRWWGRRPFWGVGSELDPEWTLTPTQQHLQTQLIELCRTQIRPHAAHCDKTYTFPRKSLDALAEIGLLGLIIPRELGGRGESIQCAAMVVETIARYGCPSTALVYVMHLAACTNVLVRYHNNATIRDLLSRLDKDKLVGTQSYSDPATGGHFWFTISGKARSLDTDHVRLLKYGSWVTSAGYADWYVIQTTSPNHQVGENMNYTCYLFFKDEIRANANEWHSLGMHGNQSGPVMIDGVFGRDRQVGEDGEAPKFHPVIATWFCITTASVWNGIAMACCDIAKKHVTRTVHADVGLRVCDYPTIQDYFGESICSTNVCRLSCVRIAEAIEHETNGCDWNLFLDSNYNVYEKLSNWALQNKYMSSKNVVIVSDQMMNACGGVGYKEELGLERLLRDGRAGWVMSPSNEIIRQNIGKIALFGSESLDPFVVKVNRRVLFQEVKKMTPSEKEKLAKELMADANMDRELTENKMDVYQDTDFENPFNTRPPRTVSNTVTLNKQACTPGLNPDKYMTMTLSKRVDFSQQMTAFTFKFSSPERHSGCLPGQYVQIRVQPTGDQPQERYLSPISRPDAVGGELEVVIKYELSGILSRHLHQLTLGDAVEVRGPCGGFEYQPNTLDYLVLMASGVGATPCLQLVRCVMADPGDKTHVTFLYHADSSEELLLADELTAVAAQDQRLNLVLSVDEPPEEWAGEEGFIDEDMITRHFPVHNGKHLKIIICGGPTMATSTLAALRHLEYPSESIFVYGQFGLDMVRMIFGKNTPISSHTSDARVSDK